MRRPLILLLGLLLAVAPAATASGDEPSGAAEPTATTAPTDAQLRAWWVDAFNEGIYDSAQVEELVTDAAAANINTLFVQVGRRFDCFCNEARYPRTDAAIDPAPFDPLAAVVEAAHAAGIEVHAWINATTVWNQATPPSSPDHVFNAHGPDAPVEDRWLNRRVDGEELMGGVNAYLDPAHPDAVAYVVDGIRSVVEHYDVDGINLDYIRYPDFNTDGVFASDWGYSEVSLARFRAATGRTDTPEPTDEQFARWRRDQVTNLVRRIHLGVFDVDPSVAVSVNSVTYAYGPQTYGSWEQTRPYAEVLQDWQGWMREGIVDLNVAMNYKRGWMADQAQMFTEWTETLAASQHGRFAINGPALYLNGIDDTIAQLRETFATEVDGQRLAGWSGYAYANPELSVTDGPLERRRAARQELIAALTDEAPDGGPAPFADPAPVPEMTWRTQPTTGHVQGQVVARDGTVADQLEVTLWQRGRTVATATTDGQGVVGFVDVAPGRYQLRVDRGAVLGPHLTPVMVTAGELSHAEVRPLRLR